MLFVSMGWTSIRAATPLIDSSTSSPRVVRFAPSRSTSTGCGTPSAAASAELSNVTADGRSIRTIAIESEDAAAVMRCRPIGRPGGIHQHELSARPDRAPRRRAAALRRHRRRHQLGQVPRRRARRRRHVARGSSTAPRSRRLGEGLEETGAISPRPLERTVDRDRRDGRGGASAIGARRHRGRRHGRAADRRATAATRSPTILSADRRPRRGHPGRGGGPTGVSSPSRAELGASAAVGRRLRHRRRQLAVHVRARERRGRAVQRRRRCRPVHRAVRAGRRGRRRRCSTRRWPRSRPSSPGSTAAPTPDALVGMGGAVTNIDRGEARPRDLRPRRRPGHGPRPCRDRSPDRAVPDARCRGAADDRRAAAASGRGDPRRRVHRAHGDGQARHDALTVSDRGLRHGVLVERFARPADDRRRAQRPRRKESERPACSHQEAGARVCPTPSSSELMRLIKGVGQRRAQGDGARPRPSGRRSRACRSTRSRRSRARSSSSTRRTWRSTRPASSFAPGGSRAAAATPWSSCGRSTRPSCPSEIRALRGLQRRGRRPARRLRVLGIVQGAQNRPGGPRRGQPARCRCASYSRRSSAPSSRSTRRRASTSTRSSPLGPTFVLKGDRSTPDRARPVASSPSCGSIRTARASWSCRRSASRSEAFQVAAETRAYLPGRGVPLGGAQQTKTRTALEFFRSEMQASTAATAKSRI